MDPDITALLNNPSFQLLAISNVLIVLLVGVGCFIILRQIVRANDRLSEGSSKLLDSAINQANVANTATNQLSSKVVEQVGDVLDAITEHDLAAQQRHEQNAVFQQTIADTLKTSTETLKTVSDNLSELSITTGKQTELESSLVSIMEDLSQADINMHATIETKIAPALDDIKSTMESLVNRLEAMTTTGSQEKTEIVETLREMKAAFDRYSSLLEQQNKPAEPAPNPTVNIPITISGTSPTIGINPAEQPPADTQPEKPLEPIQELVTP
jgi:hypothetical protein